VIKIVDGLAGRTDETAVAVMQSPFLSRNSIDRRGLDDGLRGVSGRPSSFEDFWRGGVVSVGPCESKGLFEK
jgi:hypothetical protein